MAHGFLTPQAVSGESPISKYFERKINELIGKGVKKLENVVEDKFNKFKDLFKKTKDTTYRSGRGRVEVAGRYGIGENTAKGGGILGGSSKPKALLPGSGGLVKSPENKIATVGKNGTDLDNKFFRKALPTSDPEKPGSGPRKGGSYVDMGGAASSDGLVNKTEELFSKYAGFNQEAALQLVKERKITASELRELKRTIEAQSASSSSSGAPSVVPDSGADVVAAVTKNTEAIMRMVDVTKAQTSNDTTLVKEQIQAQETMMSRSAAKAEENALEQGSDLSGFMTPENFAKKQKQEGKKETGSKLKELIRGPNPFKQDGCCMGGGGGIEMPLGRGRRSPRARGGALAVGGRPRGGMPGGGMLRRGGKRALTRGAAMVGGKAAAKGVAKGLGKAGLKKIPGVGAVAGAAFAAERAMKGDWLGAGGELLSGLAGTIPGVGTAVSAGIDAGLMARDAGLTPFARGGIVTQPTQGLVGEAGKEGVFPLEGKRGRDTFQAMGEGILAAQKKGKAEFAELQSLGLKQYFETKGGFKLFGDLFGNIMSGIFGPLIGGLAKGVGNFLGDGLNKLFGTGNGSNMSADEQQLTEALIAGEEGMRTEAYQDSEGIWTIGYGQTQLNGKAVKKGDKISKEEALTGFRSNVASHQQRAIDQVGEDKWSKLDSRSRAVLTSLAYNYGSIPDRVLPAAKTGNAEDIAKAMDSLHGDNKGVLKGRRQREQSILRGGTSNRLDKDFMAGGKLAGAGTGPQVMNSGNSSSPGAAGNLAAAAQQLKGMSTADGPDGGANGCVYAVNKVFKRAGMTPPWGSSLYVPDAEKCMVDAGWQQIPYSQQQPGDVFVMKDQKSPPQAHIGVATDNQNILSNSSSKASMSWSDTAAGYNSEYGGVGALYRMPGGQAQSTANASPSTPGTPLTADQKSKMFQNSGMSAMSANTMTSATPSPGPVAASPASPQTGTPIMATSAQVASSSMHGGGSPTVINNYYSGGGQQSGGVNPNGVSAGIGMDQTGTAIFQELKIRTLS